MEHLHAFGTALVGVLLGLLLIGLWNSFLGSKFPSLAASA